jgi:drug/metabolite transporter (DMT)-like permease
VNEAALIVTALGSALAAAASSVLQHRSARRCPHDETHRLLGHLVTQPTWIAGLLAAGVGLVLHVVALANGPLAVVQPLLISGVLFALPLSAILERKRPSGREWLLALVVVAGLAAFLGAARPAAGRVALDADVLAWTFVCGTVLVAALALIGLRWPHGHAPALLGLAAGIGYGIVAALLKETAAIAQLGPVTLFTDWPLYALLGIGGVSLALTQMAYRAGPLAHSMPALTVTDPASSVVLGAVAFQESLASSPSAIVVQLLAFATIAAAATQLARRTKADQGGRAAVPVG